MLSAIRGREKSSTFDRGVTLDELGRYQDAILAYDRAIMLEPNNAAAFNNRCWVRVLIGDPIRALPDGRWYRALKSTAQSMIAASIGSDHALMRATPVAL